MKFRNKIFDVYTDIKIRLKSEPPCCLGGFSCANPPIKDSWHRLRRQWPGVITHSSSRRTGLRQGKNRLAAPEGIWGFLPWRNPVRRLDECVITPGHCRRRRCQESLIGGFGIGIITLLGASIALMNIMLVSVTERTREIGIRKSLGATPSVIRFQFLIEAIVVCILGGICGLILGIVIGNVISSVISSESSFVVPWIWMAMGILVCVVVGVLSGIYPAIKASRLDPIEALRYE